jgi:outer membrane protein assembly factor BamB
MENGLSNQKNINGKKEINATPVFSDSTVCVGSEDFSFYSFDALTGERKWVFHTNGGIDKDAVVNDTTVFIVSRDGLLYAIDKRTGQKRWDVETFPDARTMQTNSYPLPVPPHQPIIKNGSIYVTNWIRGQSMKTFFSAIEVDSGIPKWHLSFDGWDVAEPIIIDGLALISFETRGILSKEKGFVKLYAVNAASGDIKWKFQ